MESPIHDIWKTDLYYMQLAAPTPKAILCEPNSQLSAGIFDHEYHGLISNRTAGEILSNAEEGSYLVRSSKCAEGLFFTLSLKFNDKVHHYKLHTDDGGHLYVRKKRYKTVNTLVADGLVNMYLKLRAPLTLQKIRNVSYQESPYVTLNKKKLSTLVKEPVVKIKKPLSDLKISAPMASTPMTPISFERFGKPHTFKTKTFKGLNWCELCGNFLWGFTAQGVKCEDCGFIAHSKCGERVPNDCVPDLKHVRGVFGIDLTTLVTTMPWAMKNEGQVPFVIEKCAAEIEARGLTSEGIYRLSGFQDEVDALKLAFDRNGDNTNLSENSNINVVAGTLKLYFRLLPIPLIHLSAYQLLIKALELRTLQEKLDAIRKALQHLSHVHFTTLKFLMEHLHRVSLHQAINKMSAQNLATVFAPTLIRQQQQQQQQSNDVMFCTTPDIITDIYLLEILITHIHAIYNF